MSAILLKAAVLCVAVSVRWPAVSAAGNLSGCYLDSSADNKISTVAQLAGHKYVADHGGLRYSVCVCCNVTTTDANVSVEAAPASGGGRAAVFGRRNCSHLAGTDRWLLLQYHGGDSYTAGEGCAHGIPGNRSTALVITCDTKESLSVVQVDNCSATLELRTPLSCEAPHHRIVPGLSHGSVFCILFATIAGTYLLIGVGYRRLVCGAKGIDQLPNKDFWVNLGHLQADGCNLVCRRGDPLDGRSLSRSDGWQQIAGGSFTDSDRDDAPLQP